MNFRFIVSTDLDGTLLDHHDYSHAAAMPALRRCQALKIPVILNTSKTLQEAQQLQSKLGLMLPLIVENGSALLFNENVLLPQDYDDQGDDAGIVFGVKRSAVLEFIDLTRRQYGWDFEGFNDWSVQEIANRTGLTYDQAKLASIKQYSEPIVWNDDAQSLSDFTRQIEQAGFRLLRGGRFYHIQGRTDKAKPLLWLKRNPHVVFPDWDGNQTLKLICLGDNHNDVAMLNIADFPVCVRSPVAQFPELSTEQPVFHTQGFGPKGWNEALNDILDNARLIKHI